MSDEKWVMPEWMEKYRDCLSDGKRAEELMNTDGKNANVFNNAPLALLCVQMKGQVATLYELHEKGHLA